MGQLQVAKYISNWSPQTKGEKGGTEKLFEEIMTKVVLNLMKTINSQISDSWRIPSTRNVEKTTPRQMIIKSFTICDEENLKGSKRKNTCEVGKNKDEGRFLVRNSAGEKTVGN